MSATDIMLITGASSGFGRLIAETFARKGYTVYASMRHVGGRNAAACEALRALAEAEGLSLHVIDLDVTNEASVTNAVRAVIERAGRIDILVNNAGFGYIGLNETATLKDVQRQFDTNVFGVVRMNRAVLPHMRLSLRPGECLAAGRWSPERGRIVASAPERPASGSERAAPFLPRFLKVVVATELELELGPDGLPLVDGGATDRVPRMDGLTSRPGGRASSVRE